METFEPLTEENLNESIYSPEDSPARISAKPESELELKALAAVFGLSSPVLLGNLDPDTYLPKMSQACLLAEEPWGESLENWPDSGMWGAGSVYELQSSVPAISESESSSSRNWHTPSTDDHKSDGLKVQGRYGTPEMKTSDQRLRNQVYCWPTPNDGRRPGSDATSTQGANLKRDAESWKTPHGMSNRDFRGKVDGCGGGEFAKQANQWKTPTSEDCQDRMFARNNRGEPKLSAQAKYFPEGVHFNSRPDLVIPDGPTSSGNAPTSRQRLVVALGRVLLNFYSGYQLDGAK